MRNHTILILLVLELLYAQYTLFVHSSIVFKQDIFVKELQNYVVSLAALVYSERFVSSVEVEKRNKEDGMMFFWREEEDA